MARTTEEARLEAYIERRMKEIQESLVTRPATSHEQYLSLVARHDELKNMRDEMRKIFYGLEGG